MRKKQKNVENKLKSKLPFHVLEKNTEIS